MLDQDLPPIPKNSVRKVTSLRDKLFPIVKRVTKDTSELGWLSRTVSDLIHVLRLRLTAENRLALYDSVKHYAGSCVTEKEALLLSWRLAANQHLLQQGVPALPWNFQRNDEWVVAEIIRSEFGVSKDKANKTQFGADVRVVIMTGSAAGLVVEQFWKKKKALIVGSTGGAKFNFRDESQSLEVRDVSELFGFRMWVLLEPRRCRDNQPNFFHIRFTDSLAKHNKDLMAKRRRAGFHCPQNFSHHCYSCRLGRTSCVAATHQRDHVIGHCQNCKLPCLLEVSISSTAVLCKQCQPYIRLGMVPHTKQPG